MSQSWENNVTDRRTELKSQDPTEPGVQKRVHSLLYIMEIVLVVQVTMLKINIMQQLDGMNIIIYL